MPIVNSYFKKDSENKNRKYYFVKCSVCDALFERAERKYKNDYCSSTCKSSATQSRVNLTCNYCGSRFTRTASKLSNSKSGLYFCSRKCKDTAQKSMIEIMPSHYGTGQDYRSKAFSHYFPICNRCGFTNILALEVHHVDHNRENNDISNLEILCANCHSIEHLGHSRGLQSRLASGD